MQTGHSITVVCEEGKDLASWSTDGKTPPVIKAQKGDLITFNFEVPGTLVQATLLSGPRKKSTTASLFGSNPIDVTKKQTLKVGNSNGHWGFAIAIEAEQDGVSNFYFLPDPELEVGSN